MKVLRIDMNGKKVSFSFSLDEIKELFNGLCWSENEGTEVDEEINRDLYINLNKVISFFDEVKK
jgi:hypothetical protein